MLDASLDNALWYSQGLPSSKAFASRYADLSVELTQCWRVFRCAQRRKAKCFPDCVCRTLENCTQQHLVLAPAFEHMIYNVMLSLAGHLCGTQMSQCISSVSQLDLHRRVA